MIHSVNITGGHAILGFDAERILMHVEFVGNWNVWRKMLHLEMPQAGRADDLILVDVETEPGRPPVTRIGADKVVRQSYNFDTKVSAITDPDYSCVQFLFGATEPAGQWIALSHQCFALVANSFLRGFFVRLVDAPLRRHETY
jgi:hypothetical protein